MPFKSKAQMRKFAVMEKRGQLPSGTFHKWASHTPNMKGLPQYQEAVNRSSSAKASRQGGK